MTKLIAFVVSTTMLVAVTCTLQAQSSLPKAPSDSAPKTTDQVFKNIQVLKGIPVDQLIPAMQFITSSLGVECDFCHVQNAFDKDEKKPKQTARKMMEMMFAINKENFDGLIDRYVQAFGGALKIEKITSRVEKGTVKLDGREFPVEIFDLGPDKRTSIMHLSSGDSLTIYDGHAGWLALTGRPVHDMTASDLDAARLDADLHFPIEMKQIFSDFNVKHPEEVGDHEAYVVSGGRANLP
jgi:photosynthetic reaction center cytochrome c subunit